MEPFYSNLYRIEIPDRNGAIQTTYVSNMDGADLDFDSTDDVDAILALPVGGAFYDGFATWTRVPDDSMHDRESRQDHLSRIFKGKVYTLDGDLIPSTPAWCEENEIETDEAIEISRMAPGQAIQIGGGAFASFTLYRVK